MVFRVRGVLRLAAESEGLGGRLHVVRIFCEHSQNRKSHILAVELSLESIYLPSICKVLV